MCTLLPREGVLCRTLHSCVTSIRTHYEVRHYGYKHGVIRRISLSKWIHLKSTGQYTLRFDWFYVFKWYVLIVLTSERDLLSRVLGQRWHFIVDLRLNLAVGERMFRGTPHKWFKALYKNHKTFTDRVRKNSHQNNKWMLHVLLFTPYTQAFPTVSWLCAPVATPPSPDASVFVVQYGFSIQSGIMLPRYYTFIFIAKTPRPT